MGGQQDTNTHHSVGLPVGDGWDGLYGCPLPQQVATHQLDP